jgi:hypothetical protein
MYRVQKIQPTNRTESQLMRQSLLPWNVAIRFYMPSYLNQLCVDLRGLSKTLVVYWSLLISYNFYSFHNSISQLKTNKIQLKNNR